MKYLATLDGLQRLDSTFRGFILCTGTLPARGIVSYLGSDLFRI
jgi:hypothetical protein